MQLVISWSNANPDCFCNLESLPAYETAVLNFDQANGTKYGVVDDVGVPWGYTTVDSGTDSVSISTAQSKFGSASLYVNGRDSALQSYPYAIASANTQPFTIEAWIYLTALNGPLNNIHVVVSQAGDTGNTSQLFGAVSGKVYFNRNPDLTGGSLVLTGTTVMTINTWNHIAVTYTGTTLAVYLNGVLEASASSSYGWIPTNNSVSIGRDLSSGAVTSLRMGAYAYIDSLRITKGYSRFGVCTFSPPTSVYVGTPASYTDSHFAKTAILLHMDGTNGSTVITDSSLYGNTWAVYGNAQISTAQSKFGGASALLDGSGDWFTLTQQVGGLILNTLDFTFECQLYVDSGIGAWARLMETALFDEAGGWNLSFNGTDSAGNRRLGFQQTKTGGGGSRIDSNSAFPTGTWKHLAIVRSSGVTSMYIDGTKQTATLTDTNNYTSQKFCLGSVLGGSSNHYKGYIDEVRYTIGVARYTSNFTAPVAAFPDS